MKFLSLSQRSPAACSGCQRRVLEREKLRDDLLGGVKRCLNYWIKIPIEVYGPHQYVPGPTMNREHVKGTGQRESSLLYSGGCPWSSMNARESPSLILPFSPLTITTPKQKSTLEPSDCSILSQLHIGYVKCSINLENC